MRSSFISAAVLAFATAVYAQTPGFDVMSVPTKALQTVTAGEPYTIKWETNSTFADGTVSIKLLEGADAGTLNLAADFIATGILNSLQSYTWNIPADIKIFGLYGIQISWDKDPTIFQWSNPFKIVAGSNTSSSATGGSSTASVSPTSTKTVVVSSNTAYSASTTSSAIITSSNSTTVSTASPSKFTAAGNSTLLTSASLTASKTGSSASSTSSGAAAKTSTAAAANLAKGSFAVIGGAVLAFVL